MAAAQAPLALNNPPVSLSSYVGSPPPPSAFRTNYEQQILDARKNPQPSTMQTLLQALQSLTSQGR